MRATPSCCVIKSHADLADVLAHRFTQIYTEYYYFFCVFCVHWLHSFKSLREKVLSSLSVLSSIKLKQNKSCCSCLSCFLSHADLADVLAHRFTQIYTEYYYFFCVFCVFRVLFSRRLLRALRLPFGLPFGREHFVVEQMKQIKKSFQICDNLCAITSQAAFCRP